MIGNASQAAKEELHSMLSDDELRDAALLVLANKQDLPTTFVDIFPTYTNTIYPKNLNGYSL